jgi:hypothetical protein
MATRQGRIMPNASKKNIPLNGPTCMEVLVLNTSLKIMRRINNPIKIKGKAFERLRKISESRTSNLDVLINKIEKSMPTAMASSNSEKVTLKKGTTNIKKPVLINNGGNKSFFGETGRLEAFILTKMTKVPIKIAIKDEIIIPVILSSLITTSVICESSSFLLL